ATGRTWPRSAATRGSWRRASLSPHRSWPGASWGMGCGTPSTRGTKIELELASRPRSVYTRPCCGPVAQLGERRVRNAEVGGSNPLGSTNEKPRQEPISGGASYCQPACSPAYYCLTTANGKRRHELVHLLGSPLILPR